VGKCVVCSKSCGPFNELHKACLPAYQGTRKCLHENFTGLQNIKHDATDAIQSCKTAENFSIVQFKSLVIEAWQKQAKLVVKDPQLDVESAKILLDIANGFGIKNADVDEYLLVRLSNIEHLEQLQNHQTIKQSVAHLPDEFEFESEEVSVWRFEETTRNEPQRYSQEKEWTVLRSVMNNVFMKKRYKALATKIEESGVLVVTNQGLHYKNKTSVSSIKYSEFYSVTPMKNGLRVQSKHSNAMPETYITGDGRFMYALLQYAQGLNG